MLPYLRLLMSYSFLWLSLVVFLSIMLSKVDLSYALFSSQKPDREKMLTKDSYNVTENIKNISNQELSQNEAWKGFLAQNGNEWKILWNTKNNSLMRVTNTSRDQVKSLRKIAEPEDLLRESQRLLQENELIFKVPYPDFTLDKIDQKGDFRYVRFKQYSQGIPVYGGNLSFRYDQSGKLLMFGGNIYPDINVNPQYSVSPDEAIRVAAENIGLSPDSLRKTDPRLIIYPQTEEEQISYKLCWEIDLNRQAKGWKYFIDANEKIIIDGYDRARYAISGKIKGQILPKYYNDAPVPVYLPNLNIFLLNKEYPLMYESMDTDPGWEDTSLGAWEYGVPQPGSYGLGGPDPNQGHTGDAVYGYNLSGDYYKNMTNPEYLTTPKINCQGKQNIVLRFWRWLGVEGSQADNATIDISNDLLGNYWSNLWSNPQKSIYDGEWKLLSYDLNSITNGKEALYLRWGMGATNNNYTYCGWNIDDIGVYSSIRGVSDKNGNFIVSQEAAKNILDLTLNGLYFQVRNGEGEGLIYTQNNLASNTSNITINLIPENNYNSQTGTGIITTSQDPDELNAYYHANFFINYLLTIDSSFINQYTSSFPIKITVHNDNAAEVNQSYWLYGDGIYFGNGDGSEYRDFAQFSDIIYHEVGHAITDAIYQSRPISNPGRFNAFDAMHEAFADYWACAINNDSQIAEGGFWIGHDALRNLDNDLHYRLNYGKELYESSLILSGAMWDLRQALRSQYGDNGFKIANTLFLFAMYAEPTNYFDFLLDVIAVDQAKYEGAHEDLIRESFGLKGIAEPPPAPASITVSASDAFIQLNWGKIPDAVGYNLYYDILAIKALPLASRYTPGGSSSGNDGDMTNGGNDGGWWDGGDNGDMTNNTPGGNTSGGSNTGGTSLNNYTKIDLGNTTTYQLADLQNNTEYRLLLTSYNKYGIESGPSQQIYATPFDPNSNIKYILVPASKSSEKSSLGCFISSITNLFD